MDHETWLEQHDRMLADHDQMMAKIDKRLDRTAKGLETLSKDLGRAVKLSVQNARQERKRREDLDEKITQIAGAQLENEQLLKALLKSGRNGKH